MPSITAPGKVLVTGANGFIAVDICSELISQGFTVVGTVRSASKGDFLVKTLGDKFSYAVVEDMTKPGAYDDIVKQGFDGIAHTASPLTTLGLYGATPQDVVDTAVNATVGILKSAQEHGPTVKRVVMTSSMSALIDGANVPAGGKYTEENWNESSVKALERDGDKASGMEAYMASKTQAERKAWAFIEENKPHFDLVTILPGYVFGPIHQETTTYNSLNESMRVFYKAVMQPEKKLPTMNWVSTADVARAHVLSLLNEKAGGERLIANAGLCVWNDLRPLLKERGVERIPENHPHGRGLRLVDGTKLTRVLGLEYENIVDVSIEGINSIRSAFPDV